MGSGREMDFGREELEVVGGMDGPEMDFGREMDFGHEMEV